MLAAIGFDRDPQPWAVEVEDLRAKSVLPPKLRRVEPAIAQRRPEPPFRGRDVACLQNAWEVCHGDLDIFARPRASLTPTLSLAEGEGAGTLWPRFSWRRA